MIVTPASRIQLRIASNYHLIAMEWCVTAKIAMTSSCLQRWPLQTEAAWTCEGNRQCNNVRAAESRKTAWDRGLMEPICFISVFFVASKSIRSKIKHSQSIYFCLARLSAAVFVTQGSGACWCCCCCCSALPTQNHHLDYAYRSIDTICITGRQDTATVISATNFAAAVAQFREQNHCLQL